MIHVHHHRTPSPTTQNLSKETSAFQQSCPRTCALRCTPGVGATVLRRCQGRSRAPHPVRPSPMTAPPPCGMGQTPGQRGTPALRPARRIVQLGRGGAAGSGPRGVGPDSMNLRRSSSVERPPVVRKKRDAGGLLETVKEGISRKRPPDMAKKEDAGGLLETVKEGFLEKDRLTWQNRRVQAVFWKQ